MNHTRPFTSTLLFFLVFFLGSCRHSFQCYHAEFPYTHYPLPNDIPLFEPRPQVVLVLGGGGARGMAHVGVLEELEKARIPIDLIVGCSIGSLVGALYADCPNSCCLKSILEPIKREDFMEVDVTAMRYGLGRGDPLKRFLIRHLGPKEFPETKIPLIVVATDLCTGELVQISSGPLAPAIQASCAYPLFFAPVKAYDRYLVDGGVVDPIPTKIAKFYNPKLIIAVDLSEAARAEFPDHLFGVVKRCTEIKFRKQSRHCLEHADVVISPLLADIGIFQSGVNRQVYEAGKEAAQEALPIIHCLMQERRIAYKDNQVSK